MRLLSLYTWRKEHTGAQAPQRKAPTILRPIVDLAAYALHTKWLREMLGKSTRDLDAKIDFKPADFDLGRLIESLLDPSAQFKDIGGQAVVRLGDRYVLSFCHDHLQLPSPLD